MSTVQEILPAGRQHADGSRCLAGTRKLPQAFNPCCPDFAAHTAACVFDVRYEWSSVHATWSIALPEIVGGGGVSLRYCPHCGKELPRGR